MSASTGPREARKKAGKLISYAMGAVTINKGTMVFVRQSDGNVYPARATNTNSDIFVGVAFETINNSTGTAGLASIKVEKEGDYVFFMTGATNTNMANTVYALDDQTLTLTSGTTVIPTGYVVEIVDSGDVRIRIDELVH
jgi:hypothetical protein